MMFAGLYDTATTADSVVTSCTMLTHAAGADMSAPHDREPAILHPDEWKPCLDGRWDCNGEQTVTVEGPLAR